MNYEAWRISYQSSEQAARAAFAAWDRVYQSGRDSAFAELRGKGMVIEDVHCGCQQGQVCAVCDPDTTAPKLVVKDLKIEYLFTQLGGGFAPVSTSGIKITHVPSGLSVESTEHRSQHRNRQAAIEQLQMLVSSQSVAETGQKLEKLGV